MLALKSVIFSFQYLKVEAALLYTDYMIEMMRQ